MKPSDKAIEAAFSVIGYLYGESVPKMRAAIAAAYAADDVVPSAQLEALIIDLAIAKALASQRERERDYKEAALLEAIEALEDISTNSRYPEYDEVSLGDSARSALAKLKESI